MEEQIFVVPAHAISELKFVPKVGKYVCKIQFHDHPQCEFWVSEKQAKSLDRAFPDDYSTKKNQAFVILACRDNRLRFIWSALNLVDAKSMQEKFNAAWGWQESPKP